ncbi:MAG: YvcK family protein [Bryobacterales bacterium]|nr:YvcK family protein [Bryobacteraceae bacterium]MDW8128981.1 YvcK family protein [Bryobacterales bacterium]
MELCGPAEQANSAPAEVLRIVSIGGGTGLSALLHGLKRYVPPRPGSERTAVCREPAAELTAVVTVTDDGGSSGRLRREFAVLPPGDIRNCMVALSEDEALLSRLFQYRFTRGRGLKGHSFGNLFLTALTHVTGDFPQAVRVSSDVLAIAGRIFPSTADNVTLEAVLADGTKVQGETRISRSRSRIRRVRLRPPRARPLPETLEAIAQADLVTLGPGSLFTSVVPNLLVEGIPEALRRSPAVKAYFVNLMWQPGETMHFTAADHVEALFRHAGQGWLDYVIVNTRPVSPQLRARYARRRAQPVEVDMERLERLGVKVIARELLQEGEKVRHDPEAVARLALELAAEGRRRRGKV